MVHNDLQPLCRRLGYQFKDLTFLKQALTHCSASDNNNQRYEFLGDSILSFVIANALFERFPHESEGQLSRLRSFLVNGNTLAEIAMELQLGNFLYLGQGEVKSRGFRRASTLADALEAIFAAVFFDGGIVASQQLIMRLYSQRLDKKNALYVNLKDAKTQLQEWLQAENRSLPEYLLLKIEGSKHEQIFYVSCSVNGIEKTTVGIGSNRKKAEQAAAKLLLQCLKVV